MDHVANQPSNFKDLKSSIIIGPIYHSTKLMGLLLDGKWTALQLTLLRPTVGDPRVVFRKGKCIAKE